jgi:hypothetical protein
MKMSIFLCILFVLSIITTTVRINVPTFCSYLKFQRIFVRRTVLLLLLYVFCLVNVILTWALQAIIWDFVDSLKMSSMFLALNSLQDLYFSAKAVLFFASIALCLNKNSRFTPWVFLLLFFFQSLNIYKMIEASRVTKIILDAYEKAEALALNFHKNFIFSEVYVEYHVDVWLSQLYMFVYVECMYFVLFASLIAMFTGAYTAFLFLSR